MQYFGNLSLQPYMFGENNNMGMLDLKEIGVRGVNTVLHDMSLSKEKSYKIKNPMGQHSIACGLNAAMQVEIEGHVGFYCGGMNKYADIKIKGHALSLIHI